MLLKRKFLSVFIKNTSELFLRERFFGGENVHGELDALFHHFASHLVRLVDIAVEVIVVGVAAARTDELGKAVLALFTREQAGVFELLPNFRMHDALLYVAEIELGIARELMAGVQIAVWHDGKIFVARAAGGDALGKAGSAL